MSLKSPLPYFILNSAVLFLLFTEPLTAQVTLSNSQNALPTQGKKEDTQDVKENPFTTGYPPADSPPIQDSTRDLTGALPPSYSPSVPFPSGISYQIFGNDAPQLKNFDCYTVLFGIPSYQNAQAQAACFEAQTSCARLGLIQQFLTKEKQKQLSSKFPGSVMPTEHLEEMLTTSLKEARLKLVGCVVAIASSVMTDSVIEQAGFPPPKNSSENATSGVRPPSLY